MNKREAIQAMLDGEKVRLKCWDASIYIYLIAYNVIVDNTGIHIDINKYPQAGWEIYQGPPKKIKRTFYRRAWIFNPGEDEVYTNHNYSPSKERWDELHDYDSSWVQGPWEEIEIEVEKKDNV